MSDLLIVRDTKSLDGWLEIARYDRDDASEARDMARNYSLDGSTIELWREVRPGDVTGEGRWINGEEVALR